jgi:hypothetical protein
MERIRDLEGLLAFAAVNPGVARDLKRDPRGIAGMMGVELSDEEASRISENLNLEDMFETAEAADSMAAKVAQGIGLEPPRHEPS